MLISTTDMGVIKRKNLNLSYPKKKWEYHDCWYKFILADT